MKQRNRKIRSYGYGTKYKRGFTLAELIVSIALLSVFGVIVARMFFLSGQIADRTEQLDRAVVLTTNITEQWQALPDIPDNKTGEKSDQQGESDLSQIYFGESPISLNLNDFVENRQDGVTWQSYLDGNLIPCQESEAEYTIDLLLLKTDKIGVWSLQTSIIEHGNSSRPLYSLQGERYFAEEAKQ